MAQAATEPVETSNHDDIDLPAATGLDELVQTGPTPQRTAHPLITERGGELPAALLDDTSTRFPLHIQ